MPSKQPRFASSDPRIPGWGNLVGGGGIRSSVPVGRHRAAGGGDVGFGDATAGDEDSGKRRQRLVQAEYSQLYLDAAAATSEVSVVVGAPMNSDLCRPPIRSTLRSSRRLWGTKADCSCLHMNLPTTIALSATWSRLAFARSYAVNSRRQSPPGAARRPLPGPTGKGSGSRLPSSRGAVLLACNTATDCAHVWLSDAVGDLRKCALASIRGD